MSIDTTDEGGSPVEVPTDDGTVLRGRWFEPDGLAVGAAVIASGMGIRARYYGSFARWLGSRGVAALVFDYRGFGESLSGSIKDVDCDAARWMADARDALRFVADRHRDVPLTWVGHSFGGQAVPFVDHRELAQIINIAVGTGHWRFHPQPWLRAALWKVLVPVTTRAFGYYPGNALRLVGDLPAGVMRQWAKWCLDRDYVVGARNAVDAFAKVSAPIACVSFTDDELIPPGAIDELHKWFTGSNVVNMRFTPEQLGVERVGHVGFFRNSFEPLWDELLLPHIARDRAE